MTKYFNHHYLSNSNLKDLDKIINPGGHEMSPEELEEIFAFGHLVEDCIFAPHKADRSHRDLGLAMDMAKTFREDQLFQQILLAPDLRRQHEWYRSNVHGVHARCMADADSKRLGLIFEFKGLSVNSENAFYSAIDRYDYDMGLAWYLDTSYYPRSMIAASSKLNAKKKFRTLVDRNHPIYQSGLRKVHERVRLFNESFGNYYQ